MAVLIEAASLTKRPLSVAQALQTRRAQPRRDLLCSVVSDGLQCDSVADAGYTHPVVKTGSGPKAARTPAFKWAYTALGNIKAAITGTYRAINRKHVPRYLAEFEYCFNRDTISRQ